MKMFEKILLFDPSVFFIFYMFLSLSIAEIYTNNWNSSRQEQKIYSASNETGNCWINSTCNGYSDTCDTNPRQMVNDTKYLPLGDPPYLEVNLTYPPLYLEVIQNTTFNVSATVTCRGGSCGIVQGIIRYNVSSVNPDTSINLTKGATPFYIYATGTKTYDFKLITNPSITYNATKGGESSDPGQGTTIWLGNELSTEEYENISSSDNSRAVYSQGVVVSFPYFRFHFKINEPKSLITKIGVEWEGYHTSRTTRLFIWNGAHWYLLGGGTNTTEDNNINYIIDQNIEDYIDSSGYIHLLVSTDGGSSFQKLYTDYVKVNITSEMGVSSSTWQINQSSDDATAEYGFDTVTTWDMFTKLGRDAGNDYAGLYRWVRVGIPKNATVLSASTKLYAHENSATLQNLNITGEDNGNAPTFVNNWLDFSNRNRTSEHVIWSPPEWTEGNWYETPDISNIVQEIVSREDWQENALVIFIDYTISTPFIVKKVRSWDNRTSQSPILNVTWTLENPKSCGPLSDGQQCQLKWTINVTGSVGEVYSIDVNFTSSKNDIIPNDTDNVIVKIVSGVDTQAPKYSLNSTNSTTAGSAVSHNLFWQDNVNLSHAIFSFDNCTGELQNISEISLSGNQTWSNFTVVVNSTADCTIRWKIYANDTSNNWNVSEEFSYVTTSECSLAIGLSNTLASGIAFGNINPGEMKDALGNNGNATTDYYVVVSISGCNPNTANVYIKASSSLTSGSYSIPLANFKFRNSTTDNTVPSSLQNISLTTSYLDNKIGSLLSDGSYVYLKFVLEVPSSQRAGNYSNTVYFWTGRSDLSPPN